MLALISVLLFLGSSGLLVWIFLKFDRGTKEPKGPLFAAAGFGALGIVSALWAEQFLPNTSNPQVTVLTILFVSMSVGIIEESAKFIPLALFIRSKSYFNEHTDGIIYFAISGLSFGLIENLAYLFLYKDQFGGSELTGIFRLVVLFFFHAAATGIVGYYLAKAKIQKQSLVKPIIALVVISLIHGLYDFLFLFAAFSYQHNFGISDSAMVLVVVALVTGLIVSALLNTFMFLYFGRARQWDASIGLASDPKLVAANPPPAQQ